jgi:hypothetical protein
VISTVSELLPASTWNSRMSAAPLAPSGSGVGAVPSHSSPGCASDVFAAAGENFWSPSSEIFWQSPHVSEPP